MHMTWWDLLFAHWSAPTDALAARLPAGLELDTYEGRAYVGVVPFRMSNVRPRFLPPAPGLSAFPELNVRTYVRRGGVAGVWFFSLDAASRLAVRGARVGFHLPYFDAEMRVDRAGDGGIEYESRRTHRGAPPATLRTRYRPVGPVSTPVPGSLDHFLTYRLSLFAADGAGRIFRADVAHPPWPLQPAEAEIQENRMLEQIGLPAPDVPPLLHFSRRLDVVAWWRVRV